jgi:hypothetical protein
MDLVCSYCNTIGFSAENLGTQRNVHFGVKCCNKGKVHGSIPLLPNIPASLHHLYTSPDSLSEYFRKNIRKFNSGLCMASMVVKEETRSTRHGGIASFTIKGQIFCGIGSIQNAAGCTPKFIQTYFFDTDEQAIIRSAFLDIGNPEDNIRNHTLFQRLHEMLLNCQNTYITSFLSIHEYIQRIEVPPDNLRISIHADIRSSAEHSGRYNLPQGSEVAILMPNVVASS